MLSLKRTKRVLFSAVVMAAVVTPLTIFAMHEVDSAEETFAVEGSDIATFEDPNFYECVLSNFREAFPNEAVSDDGLSVGQVRRIKRLVCDGADKPDSEKITSVRSASSDIDSREGGLEAMGYLEYLVLNNNKLTNLDVEYNGELTHLYAHHNNISAFNLGELHKLVALAIQNNQLSGSLDVSRNTGLELFYANANELTGINLGNISSLKDLRLSENQLTGTLDVSNSTGLEKLYIWDNKLAGLDLGNISTLKELSVSANQLSGTLDVSKNTGLEILYAHTNKLTDLNLGNISSLKDLQISKNQLTGTLDVSKNTGLETLYAYTNELTNINISGLNTLKKISIGQNNITDEAKVASIMGVVTDNRDHLEELSIMNLPIGEIDASVFPNLTFLNVSGCGLSSLDVSHNANLQTLAVRNNNLSSLDVTHNAELSSLSTDNIIVTAGIEDESLTSGQKTFDLSNLKFISEDGNTTIPNTNYYTFNSSSKILSVTDIAKTGGFVLTAPIDSSIENSEYRRYKLQIAKIDSSAPTDDPTVDPTDDPADDPTSDPTDEGDDSDETIVPNTSGGDEAGETGTGGKDAAGKPETGASTNDGKSGSSISISVLPIIIVALAILGVIGRKYISHKKINW